MRIAQPVPEEVIARYEAMLPHIIVGEPITGTDLRHVKWMLKNIRNHASDPGKQHRWLGFIQAILIVREFTTVDEERDFTRPFFRD